MSPTHPGLSDPSDLTGHNNPNKIKIAITKKIKIAQDVNDIKNICKPEKLEKLEKLERPQKPEKLEKPQKPEKTTKKSTRQPKQVKISKIASQDESHEEKEALTLDVKLVKGVNLTNSEAREKTYLRQVFGTDMLVSLDNRHIYDLQHKYVGFVVDCKTIEWVE